jgi:predicted transglutaminase-like cysteine proteinase
MKVRILAALALAASGFFGAGAAMAEAKLPPLGYQLMCLKQPAQCRGGGSATVALTADLMNTLKAVNARVNRTIVPRRDPKGVDFWNPDATAGDCKDFALGKRKALISKGLPASALRMAYVKTPRGEDHAVLVVATTQGPLVLDNLTGAIKPLSKTGLKMMSMAGADPLKWS